MTKASPASLNDLRSQWRTDPEFMHEWAALEDEFALAEAFIKARARSGLTQEELAERMGTRQSFVARLEGGRTLPSVRTLQKFAKATGTKLRLQFDAG